MKIEDPDETTNEMQGIIEALAEAFDAPCVVVTIWNPDRGFQLFCGGDRDVPGYLRSAFTDAAGAGRDVMAGKLKPFMTIEPDTIRVRQRGVPKEDN